MSYQSFARPFVVAATAWLLSVGLTFADGPPAQDTEQRLKALEAKVDRMLTLLERRGEVRPPAVPEATAAVEEARAKIREMLSARIREAEELQKPLADGRPTAERVSKL